MALTVSFVDELHGIVEPVQQYLQRDLHQRDLFASQVVVVPTIGVRSWLTPLLAASLGATDGMRDGIFANVNVQYVGYLQRMLRQAAGLASDPWERNRVNLATLQALDGFSETARLEKKYNGRLNAARILAERFDRYATRRPELIRSWHHGVAALGDLSVEKYHWQFELWQRVRDIVGAAPWPVLNAEMCAKLRAGEKIPGIPDRLMIAGFETISPSNMEIIDALSSAIDVEVVFVHQSPFLRAKWNEMASSVVPNKAELPVPTNFSPLSASSLRLPPSWMQSSFDLELLLAAYGVRGEHLEKASSGGDVTLLKVLQRGIAGAPLEVVASQSADLSVQIHRAHNLSRQIEVLHDALLHAFEDDKDLQPHDVVVLCADVQSAAPILEAVFDKTVTTTSGKNFKLPLIVADRALTDVNDGAELTSHLLQLADSRFDFESFMLVASSPLVMKNFGITTTDFAVWSRHLAATRLRWGLDSEHRQKHGLVAPTLNAHGWLDAIERTLMGVVMSIGTDVPVMKGGVRPLRFVDSSDSQSITKLISLLSVLASFEKSTRKSSSIGMWCAKTEAALVELCGNSCAELDDVLKILNSFQRANNSLGNIDCSMPFSEFSEYVAGELGASSGRLPLRSGSITATSFVPLRTVPFKVVCIVGFDDGTLPMGEPEGDDLIGATPMLGDGDPKIESRRVFLDALMSAEQQFIVTCTGRSVKDNKAVPLVTPLSEFLDFCRECGVEAPQDSGKPTAIEYSHPRHLGSPENFHESSGPVLGRAWSHDLGGLLVAQERLKSAASGYADEDQLSTTLILPEPLADPTLKTLEDIAIDPLGYYLREGLNVYQEWTSEDFSNVLPLSIEGYEYRKICLEVFSKSLASAIDKDQLLHLLRNSDVLPIEPIDSLAEVSTTQLIGKYLDAYRKDLVSLPMPVDVLLDFSDSIKINDSVDGYHADEQTLAFVSFSDKHSRDFSRLAIRALALIASGYLVQKVLTFHLSDNGKSTTKRIIEIDGSITKEVALEKLGLLLSGEPIARAIACPLFGTAASVLYGDGGFDDLVRLETAEDKFDEFVGNDYTFPTSNELVVFGATPEFIKVYSDPHGHLSEFFSKYFYAMKKESISRGKPTGWRLLK